MHGGKFLLTVIFAMVVHSEAHSYCDIEDPPSPDKPLPPLPPPSMRLRPPQPLPVPEPPHRRPVGRPHSHSSPEPLSQHNQPGYSPIVPSKHQSQPRQPAKKPATLPRPIPPTPENPSPRPPVRKTMQRSTSESCLAKSGYDNVVQQMKGNRLSFIQEGGN